MKKNKKNNKIQQLIELLLENKLFISVCESASAGKLAATICETSGASKVFKGGLVTYTNEAKVVLAGVNYQTLNTKGAVSAETAMEMAQKTANLLQTEIGISITGNAGPTALENKPVGLFFIGLSVLNQVDSYQIIIDKKYSRIEMIDIIVQKAIDILINLLNSI